jgi:hypothetical protein
MAGWKLFAWNASDGAGFKVFAEQICGKHFPRIQRSQDHV